MKCSFGDSKRNISHRACKYNSEKFPHIFFAIWKSGMNMYAIFKRWRNKNLKPPNLFRCAFEQFPPGVRTFFLASSNICNGICSNVGRKLFERTKVKKYNKYNGLIFNGLQNVKFGRIFGQRDVWMISCDSQKPCCYKISLFSYIRFYHNSAIRTIK